MTYGSFLRFFAPPTFLSIPAVGIEISDKFVRALEFKGTPGSLRIAWWQEESIPDGAVMGGVINKKAAVADALKKIRAEHKCLAAHFSITEQLSYLFEITVANNTLQDTRQAIGLRLEEEVPLKADDAIFDFTKISLNKYRAAAVPKKQADALVSVASEAGIAVLSIDTEPSAVARAVVGFHNKHSLMIVNSSEDDAGFYIAISGAVRFASTVPIPSSSLSDESSRAALAKEAARVREFWDEHRGLDGAVQAIVVCGRGAENEEVLHSLSSFGLPVETASVWQNAFSVDKGVPTISLKNSLRFAVASGLAMRPFSYV